MRRTLLILSANPRDTDRLRLDQEVREIDEGLQRSQRRDDFLIHQKWAVRPPDVHRALLDYRPQIVHFAGHGTGSEGILLEDNSGRHCLVSEDALSTLFELFPQIECVLLNACYTETQAKAIAKHVGYVVGMSDAIDDNAAISFTVAFYDAVGAGESYDFAYRIGCSSLRMHGIPSDLLPILIKSPKSVEQQHEMYERAYREFLLQEKSKRLQQERELAQAIGDITHKYAKEVVMEILLRLSEAQYASANVEPPNLAGRWCGMINGCEQIVEIRQKGPVVYLKGSAQGDERADYKFTGEGRVIYDTLVFSWKIGEVGGINIMRVLGDAHVLDGKYFTAMGDSGNEIYHLASNQECDD